MQFVAEVVVPAPVLAERIPHAAAPVVLSELEQARAGRAWEVAAAVTGAVAVVVLLAGLMVLS